MKWKVLILMIVYSHILKNRQLVNRLSTYDIKFMSNTWQKTQTPWKYEKKMKMKVSNVYPNLYSTNLWHFILREGILTIFSLPYKWNGGKHHENQKINWWHIDSCWHFNINFLVCVYVSVIFAYLLFFSSKLPTSTFLMILAKTVYHFYFFFCFTCHIIVCSGVVRIRNIYDGMSKRV